MASFAPARYWRIQGQLYNIIGTIWPGETQPSIRNEAEVCPNCRRQKCACNQAEVTDGQDRSETPKDHTPGRRR